MEGPKSDVLDRSAIGTPNIHNICLLYESKICSSTNSEIFTLGQHTDMCGLTHSNRAGLAPTLGRLTCRARCGYVCPDLKDTCVILWQCTPQSNSPPGSVCRSVSAVPGGGRDPKDLVPRFSARPSTLASKSSDTRI
ncbi:hypothetical protein J6590_071610 [Homalodisca vitripennis]|nr:hypothetical protein J6590_071610 [Homalodisca vitripennis]